VQLARLLPPAQAGVLLLASWAVRVRPSKQLCWGEGRGATGAASNGGVRAPGQGAARRAGGGGGGRAAPATAGEATLGCFGGGAGP
jgi:hypothetical protein